MRGCPPLRAPVGSQGVLSLDIRGLTGWNALCLVPNSTALVGCMLLLLWSNDAMLCNGILHYSLRWCVCEIIKLRRLVGLYAPSPRVCRAVDVSRRWRVLGGTRLGIAGRKLVCLTLRDYWPQLSLF